MVFKKRESQWIYAAKFFMIAIIILSIWFLLIYPNIEDFLYQNATISYLVFIIGYTTIVYYFSRTLRELPTGKLATEVRVWVVLFLSFLALDIILFPILVTENGVLPGLSAGGLLSSDIFIYNLLPTFLPTLVRYWITYTFIPSFFLTIVALLSATKKEFQQTLTRAL